MNSKRIRLVSILICFFIFSTFLYAQNKPDALRLYRNGRSLDNIGRKNDAKKAYTDAIAICHDELKANPYNMDSHTVFTWCLFRLGRYRDAQIACNEALKIKKDSRIIETLGESLFYLGDFKGSLRAMQSYIDMAPNGERISVAHFFVGEIYRNLKKFNKADIAYSIAVYLDPGNYLWWYRLGIVREIAGEKKYALEAYKSALNLRPNFKEASDAIKRIKI